MCSRITCPDCKKPSWAGCGAHVDMVLRDVPEKDRCQCKQAPPSFSSLFSFGRKTSGKS